MLASTKKKFSDIAIIAVTASIILLLLIQHFQVIFFEYPLEYRENTDLFRAYLLSEGKNVFSYENLPNSHSQYGVIYAWLSSTVLQYTGLHFYPLRMISALSILPTLGLLLWLGKKESANLLQLFLICGIVYGSYLIQINNIAAMPNALGMALFSASVLLPPILEFSFISLILCCILSGLGFFTKLYFGFGAFYILLYFGVNQRWSDLRYMSGCLIITIIASILAALYFFPAFIETNILLNVGLATWEPNLIWLQTRFFIEVFFSFIVLLALSKKLCPKHNIISISNPYFFFLALSSIILIKMGANAGAFFLYFHHLLIPFLIPLVIQITSRSDKAKTKTITIFIFINFLFIYTLTTKHNDLEAIENSFHELENQTALLNSKINILYNSPTSYFAIKQLKIPNEQGQVDGLLVSKGIAGVRYRSQVGLINEDIGNRKYQQIFIDELQGIKFKKMSDCYIKAKTFEITMYAQRIKTEMWLPKSKCFEN